MKTILMALLCLSVCAFSQTEIKVPDGLYLVDSLVVDTVGIKVRSGQKLVAIDADFLAVAEKNERFILLSVSDFVPLQLERSPELLKQGNKKKKLQLSFSRLAAEKLESFTASNLMRRATLVVDGKALSVHKIRAKITGGKMEITRCGDNACERLYVTLKDNVQH
jgi:hypothetical protein